jgi:Uncharacterised ACR, YagE family COG1723
MAYGTNPRTFDDVIYTPYTYRNAPPRRLSSIVRSVTRASSDTTAVGDLLGVPELVDEAMVQNGASQNGASQNGGVDKGKRRALESANEEEMADVYIFKYGTVVIWGMTQAEEQRFLTSVWVPSTWLCIDPYAYSAEGDLKKSDLLPQISRWRTFISTTRATPG